MAIYSDLTGQVNPNSVGMGCSECSNQFLLHTSLPKALSTDPAFHREIDSSWYRGIYWECQKCGASYETVTIVCNRLVQEKVSMQTPSYRRWVYGFLAMFMQTMLQDIYSISSRSDKEDNGWDKTDL